MMIKFSWNKINNNFDWMALDVLRYFYLMSGADLSLSPGRGISAKIKMEVSKPYPSGPCYLIHPRKLFTAQHEHWRVYNYLELASKRSLFDYQLRGVKHLPLALVPEYMKGLLETNPLLEVKDGNVYFKYEQE
jgi:hypothetical protein